MARVQVQTELSLIGRISGDSSWVAASVAHLRDFLLAHLLRRCIPCLHSFRELASELFAGAAEDDTVSNLVWERAGALLLRDVRGGGWGIRVGLRSGRGRAGSCVGCGVRPHDWWRGLLWGDSLVRCMTSPMGNSCTTTFVARALLWARRPTCESSAFIRNLSLR